LAHPDPINIDVEMEDPTDDDEYPDIVRGRTIQDVAALKLAKNILIYIGMGSHFGIWYRSALLYTAI
jgi:hypothetical protein